MGKVNGFVNGDDAKEEYLFFILGWTSQVFVFCNDKMRLLKVLVGDESDRM